MKTVTGSRANQPADAALVGQVNQLYHELTRSSFDRDHHRRHRVEQPFWRGVARVVLGGDHGSASPMRRARRGERTGRVVVDLACGTGFVTETLGAWLKPWDRLIAIDLTEAVVHAAARKWASGGERDPGGPAVAPLVGNGQVLPLLADSVDLLAVNAALHHVPDPAAALSEIDRVLKPGGYFALGFEPNQTHFASPLMAGLSRGLTRTGWYASPRQNRRRLRRWLDGSPGTVAGGGEEDVLAATINDQLIRGGFIAEPLSRANLLNLVDPHARGAAEVAGFDPAVLLSEAMPNYEVHQLISSDYLGESGRRSPRVRRVVDTMLRVFVPRHGSLFCWLIRKPARASVGRN